MVAEQYRLYKRGTVLFFVLGPASLTPQGLLYGTLWYLDQETGERINSLAADKPQYNAGATQMTVKLRPGVLWSDGVEFSADDLVYTVKLCRVVGYAARRCRGGCVYPPAL